MCVVGVKEMFVDLKIYTYIFFNFGKESES